MLVLSLWLRDHEFNYCLKNFKIFYFYYKSKCKFVNIDNNDRPNPKPLAPLTPILLDLKKLKILLKIR